MVIGRATSRDLTKLRLGLMDLGPWSVSTYHPPCSKYPFANYFRVVSCTPKQVGARAGWRQPSRPDRRGSTLSTLSTEAHVNMRILYSGSRAQDKGNFLTIVGSLRLLDLLAPKGTCLNAIHVLKCMLI